MGLFDRFKKQDCEICGKEVGMFGYKKLALDMNIEYPRANFYNVMFEKWGLKTGAQWGGER